MFTAFANVTTSIDRYQEVKRSLEELAKKDVLVGIPQEKSSRIGDDGITNAELAYIHTHGIRRRSMREEMKQNMDSGNLPYSTAYQMYLQSHGSPLWNSPPRPIIEPAIEHNKTEISELLQESLQAALDCRDFLPALKKAGMKGQNVVRGWFVNPLNDWPPNSPMTIKAKGSDKPLIDTGEMRKSITYVVRDKG